MVTVSAVIDVFLKVALNATIIEWSYKVIQIPLFFLNNIHSI